MGAAQRLAELGYGLGDPPVPSGPCLPVSAYGGLLYVAGQIPVRDGALLASGLVGRDLGVPEARRCAEQAAANALAQLHAHLGGLDRVRVVQVTVYVAAVAGFDRHSEVANAASELLVAVLGDRGRHSRTAVGVAGLPRNGPVEVQLMAADADPG